MSDNTSTALPAGHDWAELLESDFLLAAGKLGCEVACVKAVTEVESQGSGFLESGRPKILLESHRFSALTQHRYDWTHPNISSRVWNRKLYQGGEREYDRMTEAMALDRTAALSATSWGMFQVMGSNYGVCGFPSVEDFVAAMFDGEGQHLDAFVAFVQAKKLDVPLRARNWAAFAKGYNGLGYQENNYHGKLSMAYNKWGTK